MLLLSVLPAALLVAPASASAGVRVLHRAPECGGLTLVVTAHHRSCLHPSGDAYDARAEARWAGTRPATAPVACYGDGTTGPRVQLLYGYVAGRPSRAGEVIRQLRFEVTPRMQAVVNAASGGKDLGIRFAFQPGCAGLSVPVVRLPAGTLKGEDDAQFGRVVEVLQQLGYTRTDRKYQVILEGWTTDGVCGMGELQPTYDQPHPANLHEGVPTVGSRTDLPSTAGVSDLVPVPRYSVVWRTTYGPRGPRCYEMGQSRAQVQLHELLHTLGAVQLSAPHSDRGGHCSDTPSVMCPGAKPTVRACALQPVEVLDCGSDDYWNPAPEPGSYLATGDNIATSTYFGPQPQDRLSAAPL